MTPAWRHLHRRPAARAIAVTEASKPRDPGHRHGRHERRPDEIDYIIPANDDAIRAIRLLCQLVADAAIEGLQPRRPRGPEQPSPSAEVSDAEEAERRGRRRDRRRQLAGWAAGLRGARAEDDDLPGAHAHAPSADEDAEAGRSRRPRTIAPTEPRRGRGTMAAARRSRPPPLPADAGHTTTDRARATGAPAAETGGRTRHGDITAGVVKELRERTGAGFMDCKRALEEADGDIEKAIALLREKGPPQRPRKAGREAREGLVLATSTRAAASACSSRSTARPTSWRGPMSSRARPRTSPYRSLVSRQLYVDIESIPAEVLEAKKASLPADEATQASRRTSATRSSRVSSRSGTQQVCLYEQPFRD